MSSAPLQCLTYLRLLPRPGSGCLLLLGVGHLDRSAGGTRAQSYLLLKHRSKRRRWQAESERGAVRMAAAPPGFPSSAAPGSALRPAPDRPASLTQSRASVRSDGGSTNAFSFFKWHVLCCSGADLHCNDVDTNEQCCLFHAARWKCHPFLAQGKI